MRDWLAVRRSTTPDSLALVVDETGARWTYRDLDERVEHVAGALTTAGLSPGDRLGVLLNTRRAFVDLVWASQRLGAVLVPFNVRLTPEELREQVDRIEPAVLVTGADHEATAVAAAGDVPCYSVDDPASADVGAIEDLSVAPFEPADRPPTDTWVIMFTSGTTGRPKAVRLTPANFHASATASAFRLGVLPTDRWLHPLPTYHMGGLSIPIRTTIYGTTAVVQSGFDAAAVLRAMADHDVTGVSLVPTMVRRLLDAGDVPDTLRFALVGGAPSPPELVTRARRRGVPIHPTYGMTETTSQIATATPAEVDDDPATVGRPLVSVDLAVLDDDGAPLPAGEVGRIAVSGGSVSPGYLDDETDDSREDGRFLTGDVGYRDAAGKLFVLGRASDRIVTGGENVAPAEVERAIAAHPAVVEAAVVGLPDPEWGERVSALVVVDDPVDADDLRSFLADRLAGFKRPRTIAFADELPRTASGTVDRRGVVERLRDAGP